MVINIILTILFKLFTFLLHVISVILQPFDFAINLSYNTGLVFGNIWLLNDLLPVSDLFYWFLVFVTLNLALLTVKVFFLAMSFTTYLRRTFLTIFG